MITVSNNFKTAMKQPVKELDAYIKLDEDNKMTSADDLISFKISCDTGMCKTAMRKLEGKYLGEHNLLGQWVHVGFGVKLPNGTFEYLDYGSFLITEITTSKDTGVTQVIGYDKMINSMTKYSKLNIEYPISLYDYTDLLCNKCGLILGNETFTHANWLINGELWENISGITYRDILVQIAQVTASTCIISNDDKVYFKPIYNTKETLTYDNMKKLKLEPMYGEINSVVLSRTPQEDNIYMRDDESIQINGLTEYKIENNEIIDKDRDNAMTPIYNALHGISYYPFETTTEGLGWYEIADNFDIINDTGDTFNCVIFNFSISIDGGIKEVLKAKAETKTQTQYQYATTIAKRLTNTEIKVDKQQGEIELLVEEVKQSGIPRYAEAPANPKEEDIYLNTTDNIIYVYKDGSWIATSIDPSTLEDYWTKEETATKIEQTSEQINISVTNNQEDIETLKNETSNLRQTADALQLNISKVGGLNLLENSSFQNKFNKWLNNDKQILYIGDTQPNGECLYWKNTVEQQDQSGDLIKVGMYYCYYNTSRGIWTYMPTNKTQDDILAMVDKQLTSNTIEVIDSISNYGINIYEKYYHEEPFNECKITHIPFKLPKANKLYMSTKGFGNIDYGKVKVSLLLLDGNYNDYKDNYNTFDNIKSHVVARYDLDIDKLTDDHSTHQIEIDIDASINYTEATVQIELINKEVYEIKDLNWRAGSENELATLPLSDDTNQKVYKSLFKTVNVTYIESENELENPEEEIFWYDIVNFKMKRYIYKLIKVDANAEWVGSWQDTDITKEEIEKGYQISIFDRWYLTDKSALDFDEHDTNRTLLFDGVVNLFEIMLSKDDLEWQPASGENFWGKEFKFSGDGLYIENQETGYNRIIDADEDTAKNSSGTIIWQLTPGGALVQDFEAKGNIKQGHIIIVPRDNGNDYYYV